LNRVRSGELSILYINLEGKVARVKMYYLWRQGWSGGHQLKTIVCYFLSLTLALSLVPMHFAKAASTLDLCSTENQKKKNGKQEYLCFGTSELLLWIKIPKVSTKVSQLRLDAQELENQSFIGLKPEDISTSDLESLNEFIVKAKKTKDELSSKLNLSQTLADKLQSESDLLASKISDAESAAIRAKNEMNDKKALYDAALAKVNAAESSYQAALDSRAARISCQVLKDFGFQASCPNTSYQDVLDRQTISSYNTYKVQSDAAFSQYKTAIENYNSILKPLSPLKTSAVIKKSEAELWQAKNREYSGFDFQVQNGLQELTDLKSKSFTINNSAAILNEAALYATELVAKPKNASIKNLKSAVLKAKIASDYGFKVLERIEEHNLTPFNPNIDFLSLPSERIWAPPSFTAVSRITSIKREASRDFAFKWDKDFSCELFSSCLRIFVVSKNTCKDGIVEVEYRTKAGTTEARAISRVQDFEANKVHNLEIEGKGSSESSGYLNEFRCTTSS
jgi:hypothetical protein